ncbi:MAG: PTS IIA-like nitrogen regulatory protein PtsN [Pontibacterium sp.]
MLIQNLLTPSRTLCGFQGGSKKRTIENISQLIAEQHDSLDADLVFAGLLGRERLGSTGIGDGVAIPHCRLSNCKEARGYLITLDNPVDFDAIDNKPVDLLFALIVPEAACEEHLQTLAAVAELFSQETVRDNLRQATDDEALYSLIKQLNV